DPIAEALKKDEAKKPEKKAEAKPVPLPPKPQPQPQKFDARKIAELLDKRDPMRMAAAGNEINTRQNLGYSGGPAAQLSTSEIDAFRRKVIDNWNKPPGWSDNSPLKLVFRVSLKVDGYLAGAPVLVGGTNSVQGPLLAESAIRALVKGQPYTMLKPEHYEQWKEMDVFFDPNDWASGAL